jgi:hypothetical protein
MRAWGRPGDERWLTPRKPAATRHGRLDVEGFRSHTTPVMKAYQYFLSRGKVPVGWGDTYIQSIAGQNFDITNVPNGTYYIKVVANPEKVLHETTTSNDVSLRKVILGGTPGHRTVKVPAWHGIDPEP